MLDRQGVELWIAPGGRSLGAGYVDAAGRVTQALELADAEAGPGTHALALEGFDAAEDVAGPLPTAREAKPQEWTQRRVRASR